MSDFWVCRVFFALLSSIVVFVPVRIRGRKTKKEAGRTQGGEEEEEEEEEEENGKTKKKEKLKKKKKKLAYSVGVDGFFF